MSKCRHSLTSPSKYDILRFQFCVKCCRKKISFSENGKFEFINPVFLGKLNPEQLGVLISLQNYLRPNAVCLVDDKEINKYLASLLLEPRSIMKLLWDLNQNLKLLADKYDNPNNNLKKVVMPLAEAITKP